MSAAYDTILASILRKKFIESLDGTFIQAFKETGMTLTEKHKLLYCIAKHYDFEPIIPTDGVQSVLKVLGTLINQGGADFVRGAHPAEKTALEIFFSENPNYKVGVNDYSVSSLNSVYYSIQHIYTTLGLPLKSNPTSTAAQTAVHYLPSQSAINAATANIVVTIDSTASIVGGASATDNGNNDSKMPSTSAAAKK
jgi:hypothetical protein